MCEFCTEHGEGKKWYLEMKNYADELLHEELTAAEKGVVGDTTRYDWNNRFWETFVIPATSGVAKVQEESRVRLALLGC